MVVEKSLFIPFSEKFFETLFGYTYINPFNYLAIFKMVIRINKIFVDFSKEKILK